MTPPRICPTCRRTPVATYNAKYCFACRPHPITPPPCRRCGSPDYYTAGLCADCHQYGPKRARSCPDCLAWGVAVRSKDGVCIGCLGWRDKYPGRGPCRICRRPYLARNLDLACRLCWRQAHAARQPHRKLDYLTASRQGQQLFLADTFTSPDHQRPVRTASSSAVVSGPIDLPVRHRQLALFDALRDLSRGVTHGFPPPDLDVMATLYPAIEDHARAHGWKIHTIEGARRGMRILVGTQDTPGAPIPATHVDQLARIGVSARSVRDVLDHLGLVLDDRACLHQRWVHRQLDGLPEPMRQELRTWFEVMVTGRNTPPRRRPRSPAMAQRVLYFALPAVKAWATDHESLREINRDDVLAALPATGTPRSTTLYGLRCIFTVLREAKITFTNPTSRIRGPRLDNPLPPAINDDAVREALDSTDTTRAALTALIVFHGLTSGQLTALLLTDLRDGRLHLHNRAIPLAKPVRHRLRGYLDWREQQWPNTANPHLFIHYRTATHTRPVLRKWISDRVGMNPQHLRQNRILDEAIASGGDVRVVCDLFGLSVAGASRYAAAADHPAIAEFVQSTTDG